MSGLDDVSIMVRNYKCFGLEGGGFEKLRSINLIIGRNNSGKSTLLDLLDYVCSPTEGLRILGHKGQEPHFFLSDLLTERELQGAFSRTASGGQIQGNHWDYGKQWIGKRITWELNPNGTSIFTEVNPPFKIQRTTEFGEPLARTKGNPFRAFHFKRLLPDRDIRPEPDSGEVNTPSLRISPNGAYATTIIQRFLNRSSLPSDLVEMQILRNLNAIFEPEGHFDRILVQQGEDKRWELFLEEAGKGRIPLTHSGSGIKTVLLVLVFLILAPHLEGQPLSTYLFGFEELENNLHPALQRRLLLFLREIAVKEKCKFFLTTHSNVVIDLFANDEEAQILHVTHNREQASVRCVMTYVDNKGILDDLAVRASDLLQANSIVWVEGPSDRLYFNQWIRIWSGGKLREGAHYQCVFYGGRLLAHLSAEDPTVEVNEMIEILRVNRNAIILVDSDKRQEDQAINQTKQRVLAEVESSGGLAWLTKGKEIENYIPHQALISFLKKLDASRLGPYQDFAGYLNGIEKGKGDKFLRNKVLFAEEIYPHITEEGIRNTLDLAEKVAAACEYIQLWNGLTVNNMTAVKP